MATKTQTMTSTSSIDSLRNRYTYLARTQLPSLAKSRSSVQSKWPVHLDHCFMRIILDNAVGISKPWTDVVQAPATKNMTKEQLEKAIELGEAIASGKANLNELDERSLALRGKSKGGGKRKADAAVEIKDEKSAHGEESSKKKTRKEEMADVWSGFTAIKTENSPAGGVNATSPKAKKATQDDMEALNAARDRIVHDKSLTPFRQRTLLLLSQVPRGQYTTYKAMAAGLARIQNDTKMPSGCARAIGSSMRNNPFAPTVPCHRVLAADGNIGGFKGDWGEEGRFVGEKRRLLREEGVRFDGKGKVVGVPWEGFANDKWVQVIHS